MKKLTKAKMEERHSITIQTKGNEVRKYESHEQCNFIVGEDIIGLDANVLIDMVESEDFKQNIREQVSLGVLRIYTTNIALGEARHILVKKRKYSHQKATKGLQNILKEFKIIKIDHNGEGNQLGREWVNIVKGQTHIKKFSTFPNDCKILANLFKQVGINLYMTEDNDIKKAVNILKIPIRVWILGEASQLRGYEVKKYFKERAKEKHRAFHKHQKRR